MSKNEVVKEDKRPSKLAEKNKNKKSSIEKKMDEIIDLLTEISLK